MMNTKKAWQQHLNDLMNASLDPVIYAVRWARDPRRLSGGASHRRVGPASDRRSPVCALWSNPGKGVWS